MHKTIISILFLFLFNSIAVLSQEKANSIELIIQLDQRHVTTLKKDLYEVFKLESSQIQMKAIFPSLEVYSLAIHGAESVNEVSAFLKKSRLISNLQNDATLKTRSTPNDPEFIEQWSLDLIQANQVWDFAQGGRSSNDNEIVVAVIDDGFFVDHEDFQGNIWNNKLESIGDANNDGCPGECGVDDDGDGLIDEDANGNLPHESDYDVTYAADDDENGFRDDINGTDIKFRIGEHIVKTHGTKVAGIIGAKGDNGLGIAGINWEVKLMFLSNTQRVSDLIEAYNYILNQRLLFNKTNGAEGSFIVANNLSSGIDGAFASDFPIWCEVYDQLGEVGVLSVCSTTNNNTEIDQAGDMPSTCSSRYLIAVNNTTQEDIIARSTGKSDLHIDLGAPGDGTFSLGINDSYSTFNGTSASAPHVTGAIALLYSTDCKLIDETALDQPFLAATTIKNSILDGVDQLPSLQNKTVSGGRLNIYNSVIKLRNFCEGSQGGLKISEIKELGSSNFFVAYDTPDFNSYNLMVSDIMGRVIYNETFTPNLFGPKELNLELNIQASGMYIFSIMDKQNIATEKFFVLGF